MREYTNVIRPSIAKPHADFIDDAYSTAKFSFLCGGAVGIQSAMMRHNKTAILLDVAVHPGVPATVFKSAAGFAAASVGITAITHLSKQLRGEDDSINVGIAMAALGAAVGANNRSAKRAILLSGVLGVTGALGDFMLRQLMSCPENKSELHSTIDYMRFKKKDQEEH